MTSDARQARVRHRRHAPSPRHLEWMALVAIVAAVVLASGSRVPASQAAAPQPSLSFSFTNVAPESGLTDVTVFGGTATNKYLLETTGTGVAVIDYDDDGWLDVFVVNGSVLEGFPNGNVPTSHLYRNQRDGTFRDVTAAAGLTQSGWGQAACSGDYDNDGARRSVRHVLGAEPALSQSRQRHVRGGHGGGWSSERQASLGCRLCLPRLRSRRPARPVRGQLHRLRSRVGAGAGVGPVPLQGAPGRMRASRTPAAERTCCIGMPARARFEDVSERSGITRANGTYALGVSTLDFNNDGWVDLYVANDSNPSALYLNNKDGTFKDVGVAAGCAYSQDGKPQAGMGVAAGDYDRERDHRPVQDELRRRHVDALRERRQGPLRGPHAFPPASASTPGGSDGASASSIWTMMAGWICFWSTGTCIRRSSG